MGRIMRRLEHLAHSWNAFGGDGEPDRIEAGGAISYGGVSPARNRFRVSTDRTMLASIYTRIAIDAAAISMRHVKVDENDRYLQTVSGGLNDCLTKKANVDQGARHFRQDMVQSLLEGGTMVIVAVDTTLSPNNSGSWEPKTMRVGTVVNWYPKKVRVSLYNENTGKRQEVVLDKEFVAVVENPLYAVMNEPNSTYQRLIRKLGLLDTIDEQAGSGKLDIIIQLPYAVKTETKREQANARRADMEDQLKGSQYGIAYVDSTEKITQLNRPAENNMLKQIEMLQANLYTQLGLTPGVFDGTASEAEMLNYYSRTIEPILTAIAESIENSFLTKTAWTQGQRIRFYRDPFKLVPVSALAEIADKFTRNEILTANEIRAIAGFRPSTDPKADKLYNSNVPQPGEAMEGDPAVPTTPDVTA